MSKKLGNELFLLNGKNAVVMGGGGVLGSGMSTALAAAGANVAVADYDLTKAETRASEISKEYGVKAIGIQADATNKDKLQEVCDKIVDEFGTIDILVNAVGGNRPTASTNDDVDFFHLDSDAVASVVNLNLMAGAILPSQVVGEIMTKQEKGGAIINISSMNAFRPLTRIPGYSAAKAAVSNFTQWLAVDLAKQYGEKIRVNAIAPGFFLTDQNRFLLTEEKTGNLTARGETILSHTPVGRFGEPEDLDGTLIWLASDAAKFVTGIVVPVDGGFSAFSGV